MGQLQALAITIGVELPVAIAWVWAWHWVPREGLLRAGWIVVACSLVTHPIAWWASHYGLRGWPWEHKVVAIESGVVFVEAAILAIALPLAWRRALTVAALANALSYGAGMLLMQ